MQGVRPAVPAPTLARALAIGVLVAVQSFCLYSAVARIPVALALLAFNTFPLLFVLLSWAAGGQRPPRHIVVVIPLALAGLALALDVVGKLEAVAGQWARIGVGVGFALAASASFAVVLLLTNRWLKDMGRAPANTSDDGHDGGSGPCRGCRRAVTRAAERCRGVDRACPPDCALWDRDHGHVQYHDSLGFSGNDRRTEFRTDRGNDSRLAGAWANRDADPDRRWPSSSSARLCCSGSSDNRTSIDRFIDYRRNALKRVSNVLIAAAILMGCTPTLPHRTQLWSTAGDNKCAQATSQTMDVSRNDSNHERTDWADLYFVEFDDQGLLFPPRRRHSAPLPARSTR